MPEEAALMTKEKRGYIEDAVGEPCGADAGGDDDE